MDIPGWVYAVLVGIIISAFMAIKTGREERELEMENIEREGDVYMKRIEEKRDTNELQKETDVE